MTSIDTPGRRGGKKALPELRDDVSQLQQALRTAALSRRLAAALQKADEVAAARFAAAGHEAIQAAMAAQVHADLDRVFLYHRDQAFLLHSGLTPAEWLDAVFSSTPRKPFSGSSIKMTLFWQRTAEPDYWHDAVASAAVLKSAGGEGVALVSAGDGMAATGAFHEALTRAARDRLPAVFVLQDNHTSAGLPARQVLANSSIYDLTAGYRHLERFRVDGSDFLQCRLALEAAYRHAMRRKGPALIVADVERVETVSLHLPSLLSENPIAGQRDPIANLAAQLQERMVVTELRAWLAELDAELEAEIQQAVRRAWRTTVTVPSPTHSATALDLYDPDHGEVLFLWPHPPDADPLFERLQHKGRERQIHFVPHSGTALAATMMAHAAAGQRVVASCDDPVWLQSVLQYLSRYRDRGMGGNALLRVRTLRLAATPVALNWLAAGWPLLYPADLEQAWGLLQWQRQTGQPALLLEHAGLHEKTAHFGQSSDDQIVQPGHGRMVREGTDVTVVTAGALLPAAREAAQPLAAQGIDCEILALPALQPYDRDLIKISVGKTSRLVLVLEPWLESVLGPAMASELFEQCFYVLDAPVLRMAVENDSHAAQPIQSGIDQWIRRQ